MVTAGLRRWDQCPHVPGSGFCRLSGSGTSATGSWLHRQPVGNAVCKAISPQWVFWVSLAMQCVLKWGRG